MKRSSSWFAAFALAGLLAIPAFAADPPLSAETKSAETIDAFISIHAPDEELIQRLLTRGEGRSDDTEEKIKTRLKVYKKETAPVMDYYQQAGMFRSVDGTGTIDEIFQRILSALPNN